MSFFFYFLIGCVIFFHLYLIFHLKLIFGLSAPWIASSILVVLFLILIACMRSSFVVDSTLMTWLLYGWLGFLILVGAIFLILDISYLAIKLIRHLSSLELNFIPSIRVLSICSIFFAFILLGYSIHVTRNPEVNRHEFIVDSLPDGMESLTVVTFADLHIGLTIDDKMTQHVADLIAKENPDIILSVGDLYDSTHKRDIDVKILSALKAPLGKYAVLGNHETYVGLMQSREFTKNAGFTLLENQEVNLDGLRIIGMNDPTVTGDEPEAVNLLKNSKGDYTILLKHRPLVHDKEIGLYDLQLSGHTHGGQSWPFSTLVQSMNAFKVGLHTFESEAGESRLFLTKGIGYWGPPLRIGVRPELVVIRLQKR